MIQKSTDLLFCQDYAELVPCKHSTSASLFPGSLSLKLKAPQMQKALSEAGWTCFCCECGPMHIYREVAFLTPPEIGKTLRELNR